MRSPMPVPCSLVVKHDLLQLHAVADDLRKICQRRGA
jgi:hypothetical protein